MESDQGYLRNFLFILILKFNEVSSYKRCKITNVSSQVIFELVRSLSIFLCPKMSSKNKGLSVSPGTVVSVVCLLLYSVGFIRIELKFNDHDQRLMAIEEVISQMKHGMAHT